MGVGYGRVFSSKPPWLLPRHMPGQKQRGWGDTRKWVWHGCDLYVLTRQLPGQNENGLLSWMGFCPGWIGFCPGTWMGFCPGTWMAGTWIFNGVLPGYMDGVLPRHMDGV